MQILYMSGYTENAIAQKGILDLGVDLISKPFNLNELARKLRDMLGRPRGDPIQ